LGEIDSFEGEEVKMIGFKYKINIVKIKTLKVKDKNNEKNRSEIVLGWED
jgi:hypothetical protein